MKLEQLLKTLNSEHEVRIDSLDGYNFRNTVGYFIENLTKETLDQEVVRANDDSTYIIIQGYRSDMYVGDAKRKARDKYNKKVQVVKTLWLNKNTDTDIIEHLGKQLSVNGYLKELIRKDIETEK